MIGHAFLFFKKLLLPGLPHAMPSYDLSDHDLLNREVRRLPLQAQVLFPLEAPFLKKQGVSDSFVPEPPL